MKILVTTDGSENSNKAINWALEKLIQEKDQIFLMSVSQFAQDLLAEMPPGTQEKLENRSRKILEDAARIFSEKNFEAKTILEIGTVPANNIIEQAENEKVDMIVLGSTGSSGLKKTLLGSTASKVVSSAPCSVTVVR